MTVYRSKSSQTFTAKELICILAVILVLAGIIISGSRRAKARAARINCTKTISALAMTHRLFANDNSDLYPVQISTNQGGLKEVKQTVEAFRYFQALSNEIGSPRILICPADKARSPAQSFGRLSNFNLSYFYNVDVTEKEPQNILLGDRNITGGTMTNGLMIFNAKSQFFWTSELHNKVGNVAISDGSIQQVTSEKFREQFRSASNYVMRLAIP